MAQMTQFSDLQPGLRISITKNRLEWQFVFFLCCQQVFASSLGMRSKAFEFHVA